MWEVHKTLLILRYFILIYWLINKTRQTRVGHNLKRPMILGLGHVELLIGDPVLVLQKIIVRIAHKLVRVLRAERQIVLRRVCRLVDRLCRQLCGLQMNWFLLLLLLLLLIRFEIENAHFTILNCNGSKFFTCVCQCRQELYFCQMNAFV